MPTLYLLGDSTCAPKSDDVRPETGWGERFSQYLAPGWRLENRAVNGRSTRQFLLEGDFDRVERALQSSDAVLIQFGHNEPKPEPWRRTEPWTTFQDNLRRMIDAVRTKGALPYLATPIARRRFACIDGVSVPQDTHGEYPKVMLTLARELDVPCADITGTTMRWLASVGDEESKRFFMNFPAGMYPKYPEGRSDDTHLSAEGAEAVARLVDETFGDMDPIPPFLYCSRCSAIRGGRF